MYLSDDKSATSFFFSSLSWPSRTHELSDTEIIRGAYGDVGAGVRIELLAGELVPAY